MPADLPAPALLGEDSCLQKPLSTLLLPPLFYCLPPHALRCNSWGAMLPKLFKSLPSHGHLYPSLCPSSEDRGRFTIVPLPCLCLLRTLQPCLWLPTYGPVHASKTAAPRTSRASPFSIMYCHVGYTVLNILKSVAF